MYTTINLSKNIEIPEENLTVIGAISGEENMPYLPNFGVRFKNRKGMKIIGYVKTKKTITVKDKETKEVDNFSAVWSNDGLRAVAADIVETPPQA